MRWPDAGLKKQRVSPCQDKPGAYQARPNSASIKTTANLILLGIAAELLLMLFIAYTPSGNWLFGTVPLGAEVWLLALAGALLISGLEELRKARLWRAGS
ncbi:MAG TPA: cation transporting ATPase C-terminal domain-containing protein [Thiobacillus sp.]|nr:MAG: hypothetical protein B7Y50_02040 [Hydrogenophilales bacterium 28-61-11]OYZ58707.1 MAG: hypothetical protein B7Y21_02185 [Hydrogenophilales bacterium 16-61-112]OZA50963.1 MAG: hypothetical protein B7X81_00625 [Hydrogenophilales bacterium 17-61-76]HQT30758.1 cation transporting ATPase C-terminal domain-containing protein [Thiobacillus sp.]HQT69562.1 cation transporting ATPase C-terminal domain-containing protein [Thiobacillus sp.]